MKPGARILKVKGKQQSDLKEFCEHRLDRSDIGLKNVTRGYIFTMHA